MCPAGGFLWDRVCVCVCSGAVNCHAVPSLSVSQGAHPQNLLLSWRDLCSYFFFVSPSLPESYT